MKTSIVSSLKAKEAKSIITAVEEHLLGFTVGCPKPGRPLVANARKQAKKAGMTRQVEPFAKLYLTLQEAFDRKPAGRPSRRNPHIILIW